MFAYIWPLALVVISNIFYHICAKSVPMELDPFASLTVSYIVGAIASAAMYFLLNRGGNIVAECGKANWAPIAMGVVIVGLEVGYIFSYKAGWSVSIAPLVQSSFLAIALIFVGFALFHEAITWNKILGTLICLAGLVLINK